MTKRLLVCGSRSWPSKHMVRRVMGYVCGENDHVISSGAKGVDSWAANWALEHEMKLTVVRADWSKGPSAGFFRNSQMLNLGVDVVLAFWHNQSNGTADTVSKARQKGVPVLLYEWHPGPVAGTSCDS